MNLGNLIDKFVLKCHPDTPVTFLYRNSELDVVQVTASISDVVIVLEEKRDLSDNEKHDPQIP